MAGSVFRITLTLLSVALALLIAGSALSGRLLQLRDPARALALNPYSSRAAVWLAAGAAEKGRAGAAVALSLRAIENSPLNPEALTILALVREGQGRSAEATNLLSLAGSLGWRGEAPQLAVLTRALQQGELEVAVLRADALLRQRRQVDRMFAFLRAASNSPEGARLVADRLLAEPRWRSDYLVWMKGLGPRSYAGHEAVLDHLMKSDRPPKPEEVNAFVRRLVSEEKYSDARRIWARFRGAASSAYLTDGSFNGLSAARAEPPPFEWNIRQVNGALARAEPRRGPAGTTALRVSAEGTAAGLLLDQIVLLPPGPYILEYMVREEQPGSRDALRWELTCLGRATPLALGPERALSARSAWLRLRQAFSVPRSACPAQRLELRISNQRAGGAEILITEVRLASEKN